jgi:hypothetical protein
MVDCSVLSSMNSFKNGASFSVDNLEPSSL